LTVPKHAQDDCRAVRHVAVYAPGANGQLPNIFSLSKTEVRHINELQYINGYIWANIWYQDRLVKIDATTGYVTAVVDFTKLYPKQKRNRSADCMNGIAYNATDDSLLLTGKLWDKFYVVRIAGTVANTESGLEQGKRSLMPEQRRQSLHPGKSDLRNRL
jgi:hypothetical protein